MGQNKQLLLPIDSLMTRNDKESVRNKCQEPRKVRSLDLFKREKVQEASDQKIKEYLDSYKIFA